MNSASMLISRHEEAQQFLIGKKILLVLGSCDQRDNTSDSEFICLKSKIFMKGWDELIFQDVQRFFVFIYFSAL